MLIFAKLRVNIKTERKRKLGAVIRSTEYRDKYVKDLVNDWNKKLSILSTISETQLLAACSAFVRGFQNKLSYLMVSIPNIRATYWYLQEEEKKQVYPGCDRRPRIQ